MSKQAIGEKVDALLDILKLTDFRERFPKDLSGGMRQRVAIARVLALDSPIMLMDEPFGALDALTRRNLQDELLRIWKAFGKTIIFVTHDIEEALRLATMIAILDRGRVVQLGTPLDLLEHPAGDFVREFIGTHGIGLKLLSVRKVADRVRLGEHAAGEPVPLDAPLRDALSLMTARHADRLPVADAGGRVVGAIALADLVR